MAHIGIGKLYEAFKNWGTDITEEFKIGKAEQMFAQEKATAVRNEQYMSFSTHLVRPVL